jgi:hypothetical protein
MTGEGFFCCEWGLPQSRADHGFHVEKAQTFISMTAKLLTLIPITRAPILVRIFIPFSFFLKTALLLRSRSYQKSSNL